MRVDASTSSALTLIQWTKMSSSRIATLIVPGVSGSFVLLVIGMYATFLHAVRTANIPVLLVLAVGAAVGLILASKLMNLLLTRFHVATYWVILGLVAGSIVGIWPGVSSVTAGLMDLGAVIVGAGLALALGKRPTTAKEVSP